jgi:hypothetical protein
MKKIIFCLALLGSINPLFSQKPTPNAPPALSWSENHQLGNLYQVASQDPFFSRQKNPDFDYYLSILEKHIKILEYRIQIKATWWSDTELKTLLVLAGAMSIGLCAALIYPAIRELQTGKYKDSFIPAALLTTLPSLKFTRAEKKKLNRISLSEKPTIVYEDIFDKWRYAHIMNSLSNEDVEKLNYLARRRAVQNSYDKIMLGTGLSLFTAIVTACYPVYNAFHYTEYLEAQLKRAKEIYKNLSQAQERCHFPFATSITPTDPDRARTLAPIEV